MMSQIISYYITLYHIYVLREHMDNITRTQATFRLKVIKLYGSNCIICKHNVVEAAHIVDKSHFDSEEYSKYSEFNGIPLCPNHHTNFDNNKIIFILQDSEYSEFIETHIYEDDSLIGITKIHCNAVNYFKWRHYKFIGHSLMEELTHLIKKITQIKNGYCFDKEGDAIMFV